ncbi:hypothetical protein ASG17_02905 [Brevundimonas sp. Leaf363]|nr:hypothetical protein ASG17_02905 [Brevundimonas sp. Leaf363]
MCAGVGRGVSAPWDQFGPAYDLAPFDGAARTYLIASSPRTGSHWLGHLFRACGDMGAPLEYLHPRHLADWGERLGTAGAAQTVRAIQRRRTSPSGWFGVKAHWAQFAAAPGAAAVERWVRIVRDDALDQAISLVVAKQTRSPISFRPSSGALIYDRAAITAARVRLAQDAAGWDDFFARERVTPLRIAYEDLVARPLDALNAARAHLDLPALSTLPDGDGMPARQATATNALWRARYLEETAGD